MADEYIGSLAPPATPDRPFLIPGFTPCSLGIDAEGRDSAGHLTHSEALEVMEAETTRFVLGGWMSESLYEVADVARLVGVGPRSVRAATAAGRLKPFALTVGRRTRLFELSEIRRFLEDRASRKASR